MKAVLITGAYGGMGYATAKLLRDKGYTVFALDLRVREGEENIIPIEADLTSEDSVRCALERVKAHTDSLDAIVHFAGIYMLDSLVEMETGAFDKIFDVNVRGVFLVNKLFLPLLKKGSRILITTSELAPLDPLPFTGIYAVTKGALDKYAYSLKMELQLLGIGVSVLRAGAVETGMLGVSTDALDKFCQKTELYSCNAERFKSIVERVEARCVPPEKIAKGSAKILSRRSPKFAYSINRNPLLLLLNALPKRMQLWAIKMVLKDKNKA
ncbi:MAG: SDR family NAD(P)-dependent oxidoreductase [Ruminococcaceae bacterium]|nr:SDR family NAD(P)-dependent oxidoreductase [Oscillospiraceae bacterium]